MVAGPRVLLVAKRPLVERLGPADTERLVVEPRIGLDALRAAAAAHATVLARIVADLSEVPVREKVVDELDAHDADQADLIVTVGGDGTVFAVNALPDETLITFPRVIVSPSGMFISWRHCSVSFPEVAAARTD